MPSKGVTLLKQRTLKNSIQAVGVGLHTGKRIYLTLRPAAANTGIVFHRVDFDSPFDVPASTEYVVDTRMSTTLGCGGVHISTVEHLLSAVAGLGIDNLHVDVDAPEVPIMDGSAGPFVFLLRSAGIEEQNAPKKFIRICRTVEVKKDDKWARFRPYDGFKVHFTIDFDHPAFRHKAQSAEVDFSSTSFVTSVSRARTFGFLKDYEKLRDMNLACGGSLENAIVIDDHRIINEEGLRVEDECIKHKVLDVIGDLYLLGRGLIGSFEGYKSGHELNNMLLNKLLADRKAWEEVSFADESDAVPIFYAPLAEG